MKLKLLTIFYVCSFLAVNAKNFDEKATILNLNTSSNEVIYGLKISPLACTITGSISSQSNVTCFGEADGTAEINTSGGTGTLTYDWTPGNPIGDGTPSVSGLTAGTWTCTVTDTNSCSFSQTVIITEPPAITVSFASQTDVSCYGGSNGELSIYAIGGTGTLLYDWTPGSFPGDGTPNVTGLYAGTWICNITDDNNCTKAEVFIINEPSPIVINTTLQTNVSCNAGNNGATSVSVSGGSTGGYVYNWTPGNPSGDGTESITDLTANTWTCTVTDGIGCLGSQTIIITEPSILLVSASSQTAVSCNSGNDGTASVTSSGGTGSIAFDWSPGSPSGDGSANVSNLSAGTYTCTVSDANACAASETFTINEPSAISASQSISICAGQSITVGSSTYLSSGIYTDILMASDGCDSSVITNLTILPVVTSAGFSSSISAMTVAFSNTGIDATNYYWDFGDGSSSTAANPTHTYNYGGNFNVCLIASNGCSSETVCQLITIVCSAPLASFSSNINGLSLNFISTSSNAANFNWNFGDGNFSTNENPNYVYYSAGTYTVCLNVSNACGTYSTCDTVTVNCVSPIANYSSSVSGLTATFINTSSNAASVTWNFGDSNISSLNNPVHVYSNPGTYTVTLIVSNGCGTDSIAQTVIVNCALPVANFISSQTGLTAEFVSTSTNASTFQWDFGDGATSISPFPPPHLYPSTAAYTACLIASNGCGADTLCNALNICTPPVASFNSNYTALTGIFTNTTPSSSGNSYLWTFGDGTATNFVNPTHQFGLSGNNTICLTATNSCGTNTFCLTDTLFCAPFMDQGICMVTVDTANNHNIVYWDKTGLTGVDSFRIYREVATSVWSHIASVAFADLSEYHDNVADAAVSQWAYKIAVLDTCGNELPRSLYHYTIHLQVLGGGNLQWSLYSIEATANPVNFYQVYRDDFGTGNFLPISLTIPGTFTSYTDINFASFPLADYMVQVDWNISCTPTRIAINTSHSNIRHQSISAIGISENDRASAVTIFPNPANDKVMIEVENLIGQELKIMNALGELIFNTKIKDKKTAVDISSFSNGIYSIQIETENGRIVKKLVKN